jgi:hypothetical protein
MSKNIAVSMCFALLTLSGCVANETDARTAELEETLSVYAAFLNGRLGADEASEYGSLYVNDLIFTYAQYVLCDMTDDGIPELFFKSGGRLTILFCDDGKIVRPKRDFYPYSTLLADGAIWYEFNGGLTPGPMYCYTMLDSDFDVLFEIKFGKYDGNYDGVFDEGRLGFDFDIDTYEFDGAWVTKSMWLALTERFFSVGEAEWTEYEDFDGHLAWNDVIY